MCVGYVLSWAPQNSGRGACLGIVFVWAPSACLPDGGLWPLRGRVAVLAAVLRVAAARQSWCPVLVSGAKAPFYTQGNGPRWVGV